MNLPFTYHLHPNSLAAFESLKDLPDREKLVLDAYIRYGKALTDRDVLKHVSRIMTGNKYSLRDPNRVRPRITALVKKGILQECGKTVCKKTGKRVRVCRYDPDTLAEAL